MDAHARTITRMRPSLACIPCKRKKVKCEKQKPECAGCKRTNTTCVYEIAAPHPGAEPLAKRQKTMTGTRTERHLPESTGMTTSSPSKGQRQREQPPPPPLQLSPLSHSLQWENFSDTGGVGRTPDQFDDVMTFLEADARIFSPYMVTLEGFNPPGDLTLYSSKSGDSLSEALQAESPSMGLDRSIAGQQVSGLVSVTSTTATTRTTDSSIAATTGQDSEQHYYYQGPKNHHHSQRACPKQGRPYPRNQESGKNSTPSMGASTENSSVTTPKDSDHAAHNMEIDDWESKPWRYNPVEAGTLRLAGFPSDGKRYQGNYFTAPFWLWSSGQESDATLVMDSHFSAYQSKSFQNRRQTRFAGVLGSLPSKKLCDVLLHAFLLGVRPLLPLLSVSNLKARYLAFWAQRDALDDPGGDKMNDNELSFVCLLWCLLFAGAVSASPAMFSEASFRVVDRAAFKKKLGAKAKEAIEVCCGRDLQFPSLDGLVASLILYHCDCTMDPMVDEPPFIARCLQAACRLGLHREAALTAMPPWDAEIGRRVWYTLLEMEVMASIRCGLSVSHASMEDSFDTREPSNGQCDEAIGGLGDSASTISAAAQRRMTSLLRRIFERSGGDARNRWRQPDCDGLEAEIEQFDNFIDEAVARLAVRGLSERGQISSQLLWANPLTHEKLYLDNAREATVLNAFCRIRLTMMKYTVSIAFNRMFLDRTPHEGEAARLWGFQMTNCVQFLRNYLHLAGLPAFAPYQWYCPGRLDAWQECMIVLSFLRGNPRPGRSRQLLLHVLGDVFDMFEMLAGRELDSLQGKCFPEEPLCPRAGTWVGMRRLYEQVQSGVQDANGYEQVAQFGAEPRSCPSSDWDGQTRTFDADRTGDTLTEKRQADRTRSPTEPLQISNAAEVQAQRTIARPGQARNTPRTLNPDSRAFHERNPHSRDGVRPAGMLLSPQSSSSLYVDKDMMTSPRVSRDTSRYPTSLNAVRGATGGGDLDNWLGVIEIE
ncbi:hypothetical protein V8C34DRAFT_299774 [Trichoderma compactum]